jgi:DNA-binding response OmpR family regulator
MAFRRKVNGHDMVSDNPNKNKTILFADDDGQVQKLVSALLQKSGYNVIAAIDGTSAPQKGREFHGIIHLLLADVEMPGMTGIELAIQISQERPETKILLLSGLVSGMLVLNNGWQFLPKPFMAGMLRDRVRDVLSETPSLNEHLASMDNLKARRESLPGQQVSNAAAPGIVPVVRVNGAPPIK